MGPALLSATELDSFEAEYACVLDWVGEACDCALAKEAAKTKTAPAKKTLDILQIQRGDLISEPLGSICFSRAWHTLPA